MTFEMKVSCSAIDFERQVLNLFSEALASPSPKLHPTTSTIQERDLCKAPHMLPSALEPWSGSDSGGTVFIEVTKLEHDFIVSLRSLMRAHTETLAHHTEAMYESQKELLRSYQLMEGEKGEMEAELLNHDLLAPIIPSRT